MVGYRWNRITGATYLFTLVALIERPAIARVIIEPTTGTMPVADALHYLAAQT